MKEKINELNVSLSKLNETVRLINKIGGDLNQKVRLSEDINYVNHENVEFLNNAIIIDDKLFCDLINVLSFCVKENIMNEDLYINIVNQSLEQFDKREKEKKKIEERKKAIETLTLGQQKSEIDRDKQFFNEYLSFILGLNDKK